MNSEWPVVRLGDHVDSCLGKMLDAKKNKGIPQPYLGNSNVRWGDFNLVDLAEMRFESHEEKRYSLELGDLVVCEGGEPGRCAIWTGSPGMKIQKALHRIRPKKTLNNYFLYYWFRYAAKVGLLEPYFTGTTIKHLTGKAIAELEVPLPPVETQLVMVEALKRLDERITQLRETNATLESIAQALFKSWFVDFDPVRAKQQGQMPEGMDEATAELFPDCFEESELGLVPKGWRVGSLGDVACNSKKHVQPNVMTQNTLYVGLEHIPRQTLALNSWGTADKLESAKFRFDKGDILFGKLRPYFHKIVLAPFAGICSTDVLVCNAKDNAFYSFVTMQLFSSELVAYADRLSNGAKMPRINWKDLSDYAIVIPPSDVAEEFSKAVEHLLQKIIENVLQSYLLAAIRDALLPRLISGQLRVTEREILIEKAAA